MRLKYVKGYIDKRTAAAFHYFRKRGHPLVRLPGLPGSREFMAAYQRALEGRKIEPGAKRIPAGSVSSAIAGYYTSLEFRSLANGTQAMRRGSLEKFRERVGELPINLMQPKHVSAMLGSLGPHVARHWLRAIRGLMRFAVAQGLTEADPTIGVKLPRVKSDGYHTWTETEIAQFEANHLVGSKARLALALLLYTAQRRGDVVRMGPQHIRDGILSVRQQKTGAHLEIPIHPALRCVLDATPTSHLTFLTTRAGRPYAAKIFSDQFRSWCDAVGLPKECSAHGLRKAACRRLAEAGCSANEIAAISGHATLKEVERYTKAAEQARLARNAMARENAPRTPSVWEGKTQTLMRE